jgi:acyl-[acyl-carrier-protein]-phospholipid O-acyltransferase/long-chain-fatty-acid--[acyl-carrier-protein] ligase
MRAAPDPLLTDRSFLSLTVTQFLGAFNDNAFKELILLLAVELTVEHREAGGAFNYQSLAQALFALPFVLFSGFAGNLADRFSKTRVIRLAKAAEIAIMALGFFAFWAASMPVLLATLFLMGAQSAFFGPAKYGVLPEMLPERHLSRANGIILMTTWMSIILGMAAAGFSREQYAGRLHWPQLGCLFLAIAGTCTAFGVRRLPAAAPALSVTSKPFGDLLATVRSMAADRSFRWVVIANSYYWFLGGAMQPTINDYGKLVMELGDFHTSLLLVTLSAGIATGSVLGGYLSRDRVRFGLTDAGMGLVIASLAALTWAHHELWLAHLVFLALGAGGGLFGLPLQTYIQVWPPEAEKGRVVAAVNFVNWIFIFLSAGYYHASSALLPSSRYIPASLALLSLVLLVAMRPRIQAVAKQLAR